jgi:sugar O-acyltransferase (sialic acid O-acetyltransferase NeuD family)
MPSVVINRATKIGHHCIVNSNATVEHDCQIDDFVHIAPGVTICGGVTVGEETLVGANATVLPNCVIGKNVIIGAGTVVTKNIPDNTLVMGVPGKIISNE